MQCYVSSMEEACLVILVVGEIDLTRSIDAIGDKISLSLISALTLEQCEEPLGLRL